MIRSRGCREQQSDSLVHRSVPVRGEEGLVGGGGGVELNQKARFKLLLQGWNSHELGVFDALAFKKALKDSALNLESLFLYSSSKDRCRFSLPPASPPFTNYSNF